MRFPDAVPHGARVTNKAMKSHRRERVASVIRDIVSQAIAHRLNDPRVEPLTTVTRVEMVGDLDIARIYLSVSGDAATERRTLQAIRHASGFIQRIVAKEMVIRQCPMIQFEIDEAAKIARETMTLMAENRRSKPETFADDAPTETSVGEAMADKNAERLEHGTVEDAAGGSAPSPPGMAE